MTLEEAFAIESRRRVTTFSICAEPAVNRVKCKGYCMILITLVCCIFNVDYIDYIYAQIYMCHQIWLK